MSFLPIGAARASKELEPRGNVESRETLGKREKKERRRQSKRERKRKRAIDQDHLSLNLKNLNLLFHLLLFHPPNPSQVSVAARTAALVVAKVAAIDLPARAWPSLLPTLLGTMASTAADASAPDSASSAPSTAASASLRTATLEALGYVCEEMGKRDDDVLEQDAVNAVLTAVVAGMRRDERDAGVRLAATRALCNALEFAAANFESADERAYLMQVMCEGAALAPEARAREASFECLVKVAASHYDKLEPFMRDLFAVTARAVGGETVNPDGTTTTAAPSPDTTDPENNEDVAKQAIEFWCTVADEEADLDDDAAAGVPGAAEANRRFVAQAAPALVPLLLAQLTKQEEGQDADDGAWNLSMAAGTALGLVARAAKDAVVPLVVPFVTANISKQRGEGDASASAASSSAPSSSSGEDNSWRFREAATFAFGSILEGPSPSSLADLARQGLPLLLNATRDPSSQVRHTTAWAIGRVFEFVARGGDDFTSSGAAAANSSGSLSSLLPAAALPQAVAALLGATRDEAHVADKACYAIAQLAEAAAEEAEDAAEASSSGVAPRPSSLAPHLQEIMAGLLQLADRASGSPDAASARAAGSAYEALNDVVRASPSGPAGAQLVSALIPVMLQKLAATLGPAAAAAAAASADARARRAELQSLLCGVLTVVLQRLASDDVGKAAAAPHADSVMEALLAVFRSADDGSASEAAKEKSSASVTADATAASSSSASSSSGGGAVVHEEALLAAGALSYVVGQRFAAYLPALAPVLEAGLAATRAPAVCAAAVGVLGDVARAVDDEALAPWGDVLMAALLRAVQSPETPRDVKPPILSAFGDVALALGLRFEPYLGHVLPTLAAAAQLASQAAAAAAAAAAASGAEGNNNDEDEDAAEYAAMLRSGVAEAYAGVFNGMATGDARGAAALAPAAPAALDFCAAVLGAAPASSSDGSASSSSAIPPPAADASARRAAIALVGDVATAVPGCGPLFAARPALGAAVAAAAAGAGGFSSSGGGSGTGEGSGDSADDARAITDAGRWALQAIQKACAA